MKNQAGKHWKMMNLSDQSHGLIIDPYRETHCIACGIRFTTPVSRRTGVLCTSCDSQGLFRKQIIVTGITRMGNGHVCVSGIDPQTMRFVRPVFANGLDREFTMDGTSQIVRHFNLVEMEFRKYQPSNIFHTEDWIINERFAPRFVGHLTNGEVAEIVSRMAIDDLNAGLEPQNRSLFIVRAEHLLHIWHEQYEKFNVRATFIDGSGTRFDKVPVTDLLTLAFVRYQLSKGNKRYAHEIINLFNRNPRRYVRIGLTRQWQGEYWKQVTALITIPDLFGGKSFSYYERKIGACV